MFDFNLSVNVGIFSEEHLQYHHLQEGKVKDIRVLVINEKNQNINTNGTLSVNQRTGFKKTIPIYNGI